MSICRWSSDGYQCPFYIYEHVDGYIAFHVAGRYPIEPCPSPFELVAYPDGKCAQVATPEAWRRYQDWLKVDRHDDRDYQDYELSEAGDDYRLQTWSEVIDKLNALRAAGWQFSDWIIESAEAERAYFENQRSTIL